MQKQTDFIRIKQNQGLVYASRKPVSSLIGAKNGLKLQKPPNTKARICKKEIPPKMLETEHMTCLV